MIPCAPKEPRPAYKRPGSGQSPKQNRDADSGIDSRRSSHEGDDHAALSDTSTIIQADEVESRSATESSLSTGSDDARTPPGTARCDSGVAQRNMIDCLEALRATPFHAVLVDEQTTMMLPTLLPDIGTHASIVVGICMLSKQNLAHQFLRSFARAITGPPQTIIMLCVDEGRPVDYKEVLDATSTFNTLGAKATLMQRSKGKQLVMDIMMIAMRLDRNEVAVIEEVNRMKKVVDREKFWPHCHAIAAGIPPMQNYRPRLVAGSLVASSLIMEEVSRGAYGTIYKCVSRRNGTVEALKEINKSKLKSLSQVQAVAREISLHQRLAHPNVVKLHKAIHSLDSFLLLMDFAGNRSLFKYLRQVVPNLGLVGDMLCQIAAGLAHCHSMGVAHRDLKPENIVVNEGESDSISLKIVDFGCAIPATTACTDSCGTIPFIAPEVLLRERGEQYDPTCVDLWALGVIFLELMCGLKKMDDLLNCATSELTRSVFAEKVVSLFTSPRSVWQRVEHHIPESQSKLLPGGPKLPLFGMLTVSPALRWNAEQVESWLRPWRQGQQSRNAKGNSTN